MMAMVRAATLADGMLSLKPYIDYLLDDGAATHVKHMWGKRDRYVISIGGKTNLYTSCHEIKNSLNNKRVSCYIDMEDNSFNKNQKRKKH